MSGIFRIAGAMLRDGCSHNHLLSHDIIYEARGQMLWPLRKSDVDSAPACALSGKLLLHDIQQVDTIKGLEQRLMSLAQLMGENRACDDADMTFDRMEAAWQLQKEACCILGTKYDTTMQNLTTLAVDVGVDIAAITSRPDDIFAHLSRQWRETTERANEMAEALSSKDASIQEIASHMDVTSSGSDPNILDHLRERWSQKQAEVTDLREKLTVERQTAIDTEGKLKDVGSMMGVSGSSYGSMFMAAIRDSWNRVRSKVKDLETTLLRERERSMETQENLQGLAMLVGLDQTSGNESAMLLAGIREKWVQTQGQVSQVESMMIEEMEKNTSYKDNLQDLAALMGVAQPEGDTPPLMTDMMGKWMENRTEVIDLQDTLRQEREKTRQAEEALQAFLSLPPPPTASVSVQTDKAVSTPVAADISAADISAAIIGESLATDVPLLTTDDGEQQQQQLGAQGAIPKGSKVGQKEPKATILPERILVDAATDAAGILSQTPPFLGAKRKDSLDKNQLTEQTSAVDTQSSADVIDLTQPSLTSGGNAGPSADVIVVSSMADIASWDESQNRIELGRGAVATVFLCRHAKTTKPVALKVGWHLSVFCPDEIRIHTALSGLPWFPALYGSFKMADGQTAIAMEFFGSESDGRSYTIADCIDAAGPVMTRNDWFDVITDVAEGLQVMHERGYLCNDLKEDNVLVVNEAGLCRGKVIDFGIASDISFPFEVPEDDDLIEEYIESTGKYGHIAPECVLEGKPCSTSSDVFALGRLMMVIGREMAYSHLQNFGMEIYRAESDQRPTIDDVITKLYALQLDEAQCEDEIESSSC